VHFPNGEYSDLTNENIISESVSFTESICSKDVFQFGLSERSQIEFECVNMPNIYGVTIECGIEIDTSSLSASEIADIQSGTYDGTLVLESDSDIGFGYYHIPYGVFVVQSCPRSHGAMYRRRVTAYGKAPQDITLSSFLNQKYGGCYNLPETIQQNPLGIIADSTNSVDWLTTTHESITPVSETRSYTFRLINASSTGPAVELYIESTMQRHEVYADYYTPAYIFGIDFDLNVSFIESVIADLERQGYTLPTGRIAINFPLTYKTMLETFFYPSVRYVLSGMSSDNRAIISRTAGTTYFYPYMPIDIASGFTYIYIPGRITKCTLRAQTGSATIHEYGPADASVQNVSLFSEQITDTALQNLSISIKGAKVDETSTSTTDVYSYLNVLDLPNLYNGVFELMGCFRRIGRNGEDKTVILSNDTPYAIVPSQYSELWYDDFEIDNIGTILLSFYDETYADAQTTTYEIGTGSSVYDMTDNYLLNNLSGLTQADVFELIDTYFVPNISAVNFLPYEMTALNIPYFEPGDYVQIDNGDNGTVDTFILSRNISGIQTLYDDSEASSGKLDGEG
jgi:hypothetical protein